MGCTGWSASEPLLGIWAAAQLRLNLHVEGGLLACESQRLQRVEAGSAPSARRAMYECDMKRQLYVLTVFRGQRFNCLACGVVEEQRDQRQRDESPEYGFYLDIR